jgi:hypothetical protein
VHAGIPLPGLPAIGDGRPGSAALDGPSHHLTAQDARSGGVRCRGIPVATPASWGHVRVRAARGGRGSGKFSAMDGRAEVGGGGQGRY